MTTRPFGSLASLLALTIALGAAPARATEVAMTALVTDDQTANPAQITDPGLTNAWGLSSSPTSPFWVSSNGGGTSVLYSVNPATQATTKVGLTVAIPGDSSVTGQVFNGTSAFNGDAFLFVSEDGTVSGWRGALGTTAETLGSPSTDNVYKGLAIATVGMDRYAYAANFRSGNIDVFKGGLTAPNLTGNFVDPNVPGGYAPFNIQNLGGTLYVTYAQQEGPNSRDEVHGAGLGFVDAFDLNGNFLRRVATGGTLNAPWGLVLAPSSFGFDPGTLLVGNFGDGTINAFNPLMTDKFLGQVLTTGGSTLSIDGLWGLAVGNNAGAGSSQDVYFTAGPGDESHGLFGVLTAVPEPATWMLMLLGFGFVGAVMRRSRSHTTVRLNFA
jgi:uncharacterized protein (TIGR03118 family)